MKSSILGLDHNNILLLVIKSLLLLIEGGLGRGILQEPEFAHSFSFRGNTQLSDYLNQTRDSRDFFYILMGDTQYWYRCTPENLQCWTATQFCNGGEAHCQRLQGNHTNRLQEASLRGLIAQMASRGTRPKGLIINGDLTNYGHLEELTAYKASWEHRVQGVRLYPGLGNHDYANNVDDCTLNHCAHRMLNWFKRHVQYHMHIPVDLRQERDFMNVQYHGSLAYSWDECAALDERGNLLPPDKRKCVHFIQLNNYPTYHRYIEYLTADWNIESSLRFLESDLRQNRKKPIVINFHDWDTHFTPEAKLQFVSVINQQHYRILGIFFAHLHSKVGLHPRRYLCLNRRRVPLIYSGSVPANNYVMARLNPDKDTIQQLFAFHVHSDSETTVREIEIYYGPCY